MVVVLTVGGGIWCWWLELTVDGGWYWWLEVVVVVVVV